MSIYRRMANLFSRDTVEREIENELAAHIEMRVAENMGAGITEREAGRRRMCALATRR